MTNNTNTGAQALAAVAKKEPEKKAAEKKDEKKPAASTEEEIVGKMKKLEGELAKKEQAAFRGLDGVDGLNVVWNGPFVYYDSVLNPSSPCHSAKPVRFGG